jgi:hypothetical protein
MSRVLASSAFLCALLLIVLSSSPASAQIIYTPVQYQYFSGGRPYYYGGTDPGVHQDVARLSLVPNYGRTNGYAFQSGDIDRHREVSTERARVYTDALPGEDARQFGFTPNDAANEALANSPCYFRKADVIRYARVQPDGSWVVPANTVPARGSIEIRGVGVVPRTPVYTEPKPILIIPKRLLDKKLWPDPQMRADAR